MRTKKKSSGKIPEKKSAVPYKSAAPHRHKPSRPLQTVKLPKSQMPSRQTEEHQALLRTKYHKKRQRLKHIFRILVGVFVILAAAGGVFYGWNILSGNYFGTPEQAFDSSEVFTNALAAKENMRTESFAQKLCVSSKGNVDCIKNAQLEEGQKGLLFSLSNHKVLYANGIYDKVYPASITKIMTAMLALQSGKLNDTVTITQDNVTLEDGSQVCGFVAGDQVTLDQLLHCLLVYSGNDAASAIAEYVGGSTENFVQMMNDYAAKLGCTGTHFSNPHGLQDENHYTTPYDIYLMLNEAFTYPEFTEITELPVQRFLLITAVPGILAGVMQVYQQVLRGVDRANQALMGGVMQLITKIAVVAVGAWGMRNLDVVWLGWPASFVAGTVIPYFCFQKIAREIETE